MALGLFFSAFARTEFQAVQFLPAVVLPQFLVAGLLVPRDQMADVLEWISYFFPLTYAIDALIEVTTNDTLDGGLALDLGVIVGSIMLALSLGAATLRRRTD
jgi:ABC-2 type transport system permease protein